MRMNLAISSMTSPPYDARNISGDRIGDPESLSKQRRASRPPLKYETTPSGDVVVVEPSFDEGDHPQTDKSSHKSPAQQWQTRSPNGEKVGTAETDERSSPSRDSDGKRRHTRNLSEHFFDATTLSTQPREAEPQGSTQGPSTVPMRGPPPSTSPATGQKHRRVFSGEVSNPPNAHRRINSIGNSASIKRNPYGPGPRQHQRVDSAGLDVLTAAVDASSEELEAAVGPRPRGRSQRNPWEPPSATSGRRPASEMTSYDYSNGAMNVPPPRSHHRSYHHPFHSHQQQRYMSSPMGPHLGPPPSYPQPAYPPSSYYPQPPTHGYTRSVPPASGMGYPVQYARGHDPNMKQPPHGPPQQLPVEPQNTETDGRQPSPTAPLGDERIASDEKMFGNAKGSGVMTPPPPVPPSQWRGGSGTNQGVQTFVTAIGVEEGGRTMHPSSAQRNASTNTEPGEHGSSVPSAVGHHRKLSSFSSIGPLSSIFHAPPGESSEHPLKGHHRSTSSSMSFMQAFDVGLEGSDAAFLRNLHASNANPAPAFAGPPSKVEGEPRARSNSPVADTNSTSDSNSKLAPGGTSKRVRRKCTVANCPNRVVQGGLCIAHGAKRKTCKHPGCSKNVKKAGLCSTHGPARKRCEAEGCSKVAVQGGRCIAHGAKKKLCSVESCAKQAILGGMCKKHHDQNRNAGNRGRPEVAAPPESDKYHCKVIDDANKGGQNRTSQPPGGSETAKSHKKGHTRGLSIFQDLSADAVGSLLSTDDGIGVEPVTAPREDRGANVPPTDASSYRRPGHRSSGYSRDYNMY